MGRDFTNNENRYKSLSSSEYPAWFPVVDFNLNLFKRITTMAEARALIWVLNYIGVPVAFLGWLLNTNLLKGLLQIAVNPAIAAVVGVVGIFFALAKLVVFCITSYQNIQMRQMKLNAEKKKLKNQ